MTCDVHSTNILCGVMRSMGANEKFLCKKLHAIWRVAYFYQESYEKFYGNIMLVVRHCMQFQEHKNNCCLKPNNCRYTFLVGVIICKMDLHKHRIHWSRRFTWESLFDFSKTSFCCLNIFPLLINCWEVRLCVSKLPHCIIRAGLVT